MDYVSGNKLQICGLRLLFCMNISRTRRGNCSGAGNLELTIRNVNVCKSSQSLQSIKRSLNQLRFLMLCCLLSVLPLSIIISQLSADPAGGERRGGGERKEVECKILESGNFCVLVASKARAV